MTTETKPETTTLAKREPSAAAAVPVGERGIMLQSLDQLLRFADLCVKEGAAPKGMERGSAAIAIQAGLEVGLGPLGGLRYGTVINGVFSWNVQGAYALIANSPLCKPGTLRAWTEGEGEEAKGVAEAWRVHNPAISRYEFSVKEARRAGLIPAKPESPWTKYPKRMLRHRALGFLARDEFPDVLGGFPLSIEVEDHPEMSARVVSAPKEVAALPPPAHDPLLEVVLGRKRPTEAVIEVPPDARRNATSPDVAKLQPPPDDGLDDEDDLPASHLEADRELVAEEERQAKLFEER